jgi:hypothetical protein
VIRKILFSLTLRHPERKSRDPVAQPKVRALGRRTCGF